MEFEEVMDHIERADVDSKGFLTREELNNYFTSINQNPDSIDVSGSFSHMHFKLFDTNFSPQVAQRCPAKPF